MKTLIIILMLSGCDRLIRGVEDDRRAQMDCEMTTPDGAVMRCSHDVERNVDTDDDSISVKHPVGGK